MIRSQSADAGEAYEMGERDGMARGRAAERGAIVAALTQQAALKEAAAAHTTSPALRRNLADAAAHERRIAAEIRGGAL